MYPVLSQINQISPFILSMWTSPDDDIIRTTEQRASQLLEYAVYHQHMTYDDQWLYSAWKDQPDWLLLERLLTNNESVEVSISLIMGCLQVYRCGRETDDRQASLLKRISLLAYQSTKEKLSQGEIGMLTGSGMLHYLLYVDAYSEQAYSFLNNLLRQATQCFAQSAYSESNLSVEKGKTGLMLTLIEAALVLKSTGRIDTTVRDIEDVVGKYVQYLLDHQIPVDSQGGSWSIFPDSVNGMEWDVTDQLSWARGDLGQLLLLYQADQLLDRTDIVRWANRLSGYVLQRRKVDRLHVDSTGLVDGSAGLSLLYRRIYLLTGNQSFQHEGEYWLLHMLTRLTRERMSDDWSLSTGLLGSYGAIRQWQGRKTSLDLLFL